MRNSPTPVLCAAVLAGGIVSLANPGHAQSAADFYKGKTIEMFIGFTQGGGYDLYARVVARNMEKHIPGQPKIVPKQMTGAGSRKAAAYVYNVAPQDGTAMATADQSLPLQQALEDPSIQFDATKLLWIGNVNADINTLALWHTHGITSIEQCKEREIVLGATGPNTSAQYPQVMNNLLGTKFKIISGYPGGADINLAMERGEVSGKANTTWAAFKSITPEWVKESKIVPLVQFGLRKDPELPNVPLLTELAADDEQRRIFELVCSTVAIGQPFALPPNTPADRVAAVRAAFEKTLLDPGYRSDAGKLAAQVEMIAITGDEVTQIAKRTIETPPALVEKTRVALEVKGATSKAGGGSGGGGGGD